MRLERDSRYRERLGDFVTYGMEEQALSGCTAAGLHFPEARHERARKVGEDRWLPDLVSILKASELYA